MIELEGLEEVIKTLKGVVSEEVIQDKLAMCCALVERSAKQNAPKGDGELRRSITSKVEGLDGIVFTPLLYAPYVEYGTGLFAEEGGRKDVPWSYKDEKGEWHSTRGMKPSPYMRPALDDNREEIIKILRGV